MKFNKIYESLLSDGASKESTLKDIQIGDNYIFLNKKKIINS